MYFMNRRFLLGAVTFCAALPVGVWTHAAEPGGGPKGQFSSGTLADDAPGVHRMVAESRSSSSASASASSSARAAGNDGECVVHVRSSAQAEANGEKRTDREERIVRGKGKDCSARASAKAAATVDGNEANED